MRRGFLIRMCVVLSLALTLTMLPAGCAKETPAPSPKPTPTPTTPTPAPKPTPTSVEVEELKIGVILSYTGPASAIFLGLRKAMDLQAEEVNTAGGVTVQGQKYKVVLIHEDDALTVEGALTAFRKLVYQDNVKFIIGPSITPLVQAIARDRDQLKVLNFEVGSSFDLVGEYAFKPHMSGDLGQANMVRYAAEAFPKAKRYLVFGPNNQEAKDKWTQVKDAIDTMPGRFEVVDVLFYEPGIVEFTPLLTGLLTKNPDIIDLCSSTTEDGLLIIKQARDLGFKGPFIVTYAFTKSEALKVLPPEYIRDLLLMGMDWNKPPTPQLADFAKRHQARYGEPPHLQAGYIVDHLPLMLKGIQEANTFDTTKIVQTIESWPSFDTHFGKATWGGLKTVGYKRIIQRSDVVLHVKSADNWEPILTPPPVVP